MNVWPEEFGGDIGPRDLTHRFPWTFPILFSPHDPNVLYACGEKVFRSTDNGHSWQPISPDLTRNDKSKLGPSGGDITFDTSGAGTGRAAAWPHAPMGSTLANHLGR